LKLTMEVGEIPRAMYFKHPAGTLRY